MLLSAAEQVIFQSHKFIVIAAVKDKAEIPFTDVNDEGAFVILNSTFFYRFYLE